MVRTRSLLGGLQLNLVNFLRDCGNVVLGPTFARVLLARSSARKAERWTHVRSDIGKGFRRLRLGGRRALHIRRRWCGPLRACPGGGAGHRVRVVSDLLTRFFALLLDLKLHFSFTGGHVNRPNRSDKHEGVLGVRNALPSCTEGISSRAGSGRVRGSERGRGSRGGR